MTSIKNATWKVGRRELLAMVAGILLYALLSWLTNFANLAGTVGADIRPAVAIPILFGFIFGPTVGFVTGMFGNMAYDFLYGYIPYSPDPTSVYNTPLAMTTAALYLNWQIGNGLSGLVPGIMALYHRRYTVSLSDVLQMLIYIVAAVAVGIGFATITDTFIFTNEYWIQFFGMTAEQSAIQVSIDTQFVPIFGHNLLSALLFVPLILFNYERLDLKYLFSGQWLSSGLLRRLTVLIVISAAIPTILLSFFLIQENSSTSQEVVALQQQVGELQQFIQTGATQSEEELPAAVTTTTNASDNSALIGQLFITVALTLVVTIINSVLASQSISRPLLKLTDAARQMERGELSLDGAKELEATVGTDEVSQLSSMFGSMASEVIAREAALKQQVESLKIEVDLVKQQRAVSEITDSDFFKDLQSKARHLRDRDIANTSQIKFGDVLSEVGAGVDETHPPTSVDDFVSSEDEPASSGN